MENMGFAGYSDKPYLNQYTMLSSLQEVTFFSF